MKLLINVNSIYHLFNITYLRSVLLYYNFKFIPFVLAFRVTKPNLNFAFLLYVLSLFGAKKNNFLAWCMGYRGKPCILFGIIVENFANIPEKSLFEQQKCITFTKPSILGEVEIRIYVDP